MTKLEEKLKELKFDKYKEQNGDIVYEKDIVVIKLNYNNTKIKKIYTVYSEGYSAIDLANVFETLSSNLKELGYYD